MNVRRATLRAAIAASLVTWSAASGASTLTTSLSAFDTGVAPAIPTNSTLVSDFDLKQLFLPTTGTIPLADGVSLGLSNIAQVTQPQNGFPYLLSDGYSGDLLIPQDSNGNQVSSETITTAGLTAFGFEVAPFSSSAGAPYENFAGGPYNVTVTLSNNVSQTVSLPGGNDNTGTTQPQFFGFYGGGITSLTISTTDPNGLGFGNFYDVAAPIPEPSSLALVLAGAGLLAAIRRRRGIGAAALLGAALASHPAAADEASRTAPPRLSGVVVSGAARQALFVAADGSTAAVREGDQVGPFTVRAIRQGEVEIEGASGSRLLAPTPDDTARNAPMPARAMVGFARREAETENDQ